MEKQKRGRKSKYETNVKPRFEEIRKLLKKGILEKDIAKFLGVGKTAFNEYKKKYPELKELIRENRIDPVEEIKSAIYQRAIGFEYVETKRTYTEIELEEGIKQALINLGVDIDKLSKPKLVKVEEYKRLSLPDLSSGLVLLKHWDKETEWTNDPQTLDIKKQELEIKKKEFELNKKIKEDQIF